MDFYPSYFSLYLASQETPKVPKRAKKKDKTGQNSTVWYPSTSEDLEKPSKKKPLIARAVHKSIKRIKSTDFNPIFKKTNPKPELDHQIGNSSFFQEPFTIGEVYKTDQSEKFTEYCL